MTVHEAAKMQKQSLTSRLSSLVVKFGYIFCINFTYTPLAVMFIFAFGAVIVNRLIRLDILVL